MAAVECIDHTHKKIPHFLPYKCITLSFYTFEMGVQQVLLCPYSPVAG